MDENIAEALSKDDFFDESLFREQLAPYEYKTEKGGITVTGIKDKSLTRVALPEGVTAIGPSAFSELSIKEISLPTTLAEIGSYAFYRCQKLTRINLGGTVHIGKEAFRECSSLTAQELPEGLFELDDYAFYGCDALEELNIPRSLKKVGKSAFQDCDSLTKVYITDIESWFGIDFADYTANPLGAARLYLGGEPLTELRIPTTVTSIKKNSLAGLNIDRLIVHSGVREFGFNCFAGAEIGEMHISNLRLWCQRSFEIYPDNPICHSRSLVVDGTPITDTLTVPEGVTELGDGCFYGLCGISSLILPNSLTRIGQGVFAWCEDLRTVCFGKGLTHIGNGAFLRTGLTSLTLPEGLTEIGDDAFSACEGLESVAFPRSLRRIGKAAFLESISLCSLTFPEGSELTEIDDNAFSDTAIRNFTLPSGLLRIGAYAFEGCLFESIILPDSLCNIDSGAFFRCEELAEIAIPSNIKKLSSLFCGCCALSRVFLPEGLLEIGRSTFSGCHSLTAIRLPRSAEIIGDEAFADCSRLQYINLPEGLRDIGCDAFRNCIALTELTLPQGLEIIGVGALRGCDSIESITLPFMGRTADTNGGLAHPFADSTGHLPKKLTRVGIKRVTELKIGMLQGCEGLIKLALPSTLRAIDPRSLAECTTLTDLYLEGEKKRWKPLIKQIGSRIKGIKIHFKYEV